MLFPVLSESDILRCTVEKADITDDLVPQKKMVEKNITVASMRADVIFGAVFNESRESIKQLINAEKASVNCRCR